ncbi:unnamed protein product [Owenia fusiformis]|uniref:G-protein coupled receptors family 1 profile domain-containing protein n=1 Tax=Owenia fusiformis TaxID=6347 RepID=A0A8S4NP37_OWEFU|nr:unnamed protein product [Owenia fusiformis]
MAETVNYNVSDGNMSVFNATNNTATEEQPDQTFDIVVNIGFLFVVCLFGLFGNTVAFIVLWQDRSRSPMFHLLRSLTVSDSVFLGCVFCTEVLTRLLYMCEPPPRANYNNLEIVNSLVIWPMGMMSQLSTIWLTVAISMERTIAVCYPLKAYSLSSLSKARLASSLIVIGSILYNIPRCFEYETFREDHFIPKTKFGSNIVYRYFYSAALYFVVFFCLPLILLIITNTKVIVAFKRMQKQQKEMNVIQKRENRLTMVALSVVCVFFACGMPALIVNFIDSTFDEHSVVPDWWVIFLSIANFLVAVNAAIDFVLYCFLGKKFRKMLLKLFHCDRPKILEESGFTTEMSEC